MTRTPSDEVPTIIRLHIVQEQAMLQNADNRAELFPDVLNGQNPRRDAGPRCNAVVRNESFSSRTRRTGFQPYSSIRHRLLGPYCAISTGRWNAPMWSTSLLKSMIQMTSFGERRDDLFSRQSAPPPPMSGALNCRVDFIHAIDIQIDVVDLVDREQQDAQLARPAPPWPWEVG